MSNISPEYAAALETENKALNTYVTKRYAYRKRLIGDEEYLEARKIYNLARDVFDAAFIAEQKRGNV